MLRHALLSLSAALLYTISLPPFGFGAAAFLVGLPLALLLLDPARPLDPARAWAFGLLFGEAATLAVGGHWLYVAAHELFGKSAGFSLGFTLLTTVTHAGVFIGAGVALSAVFARLASPYARAGAFAATWVALELLRARLLYGCPWNFLGHALHPYPSLLVAAAYGGAYVLSALAALAGALAGQSLIVEGRGPKLRLLAAALAVPFGMWALDAASSGAAEVSVARDAKLAVGIVQPGVGRHDLWDPAKRARHFEQLLELSRAPELAGVDLVVWPENAVPFLLDADSDARARITALAHSTGAYVMTGAPRSESGANGRTAFYNSVYLFSPADDSYRVYDKAKLLPYVEETPVFARGLVERANGIEYTPGRERTLFDVEGWKLAPLVCFESTYPEITRAAALAGADVLVNLSNDSWFDRGAAPEQHFGMTVVRSVETGLPLVRVANTGVSAVVEPDGTIAEELPARRSAVARFEVRRARLDGELTFYVRWGDVFAWSCVGLAAAAGVVASRRRIDPPA